MRIGQVMNAKHRRPWTEMPRLSAKPFLAYSFYAARLEALDRWWETSAIEGKREGLVLVRWRRHPNRLPLRRTEDYMNKTKQG